MKTGIKLAALLAGLTVLAAGIILARPMLTKDIPSPADIPQSAPVPVASAPAPANPATAAGVIADYDLAVPDFTLQDINGKSHTLSDYKGKVVFLNFWATWCPPCRREMPSMQALDSSWDKSKFVMLAVNIRESKDKVKSFADQNKYAFPILLDTDGKAAKDYNVQGIPATYILGEKGNLIKKIVGSREWTKEELEKILR